MARTAKKIEDTEQQTEQSENAARIISAADYSDNMFKDGDQGAALSKRTAKGYDQAVNRADAESSDAYGSSDMVETLLNGPTDTAHSRDGTDAVGSADEAGGSLGGTEKELDAMEASAIPVDKSAHMKD